MIGKRDPWLWVYCRDYRCGHVRAVALAPWAIRWGVANPVDLIEERFRCVMCDQRGATVRLAGIEHEAHDYQQFSVHRAVGISCPRRIPESWEAHAARSAAIYEAQRPNWSRFWPS